MNNIEEKLVACPLCYDGHVCTQLEYAGNNSWYEHWDDCFQCSGTGKIPESDAIMLILEGVI